LSGLDLLVLCRPSRGLRLEVRLLRTIKSRNSFTVTPSIKTSRNFHFDVSIIILIKTSSKNVIMLHQTRAQQSAQMHRQFTSD